MESYWLWWGLAVLLGMLEMLTPTFYMLVLALGFAAGGLVAWAGGGFAFQLLAAAAISIVGWLLLRKFGRRLGRTSFRAGRDVLLDIGERVHVDHWDADRRARVVYRGADWAAELDPRDTRAAQPGEHVIERIDGSRLILSRVVPPSDPAST
jgi:membrane protein implicated in regulation of membrane protease activity